MLRVEGRRAAILTAERTALNFLGRLSRRRDPDRALRRAPSRAPARRSSTRARPRRACGRSRRPRSRAGGGVNHRIGLFDAILIKENHAALAGGVGEAVRQARGRAPRAPARGRGAATLAEIDEALAAGAPRLLLDNMTPDELRAAVARVGGRAELEASGGFTLDSLRAVASTGVNFISVGALTH